MNFYAIDAERRRQGRSVSELSKSAGVAYSTYWFIKTGRTRPRPQTLKRYECALRLRPHAVPRLRLEGEAIGVVYRAFLREFAREKGLDPGRVLAQPARGVPSDPQWLAAARIRELALYCVVTEFAIPMAALARQVGVTKQAISKAAQRVEEAREDDPWVGRNGLAKVIARVAEDLKGEART